MKSQLKNNILLVLVDLVIPYLAAFYMNNSSVFEPGTERSINYFLTAVGVLVGVGAIIYNIKNIMKGSENRILSISFILLNLGIIVFSFFLFVSLAALRNGIG